MKQITRFKQRGLTLLEVLIALSIFAVIGSASYQVLNTTIENQKVGQHYSLKLARQQKAMAIIDRDLQQLVARSIRKNGEKMASLIVNPDGNVFEFSRAGRRNPLQLPRSQLLRIAYDVGLHPQADNKDSSHYQDERNYFRRHIWASLDRNGQTAVTTQALLADVDAIKVSVFTESGRQLQWPPVKQSPGQDKDPPLAAIKALEISWPQDNTQITRLYPVL